MRPLYSFSSVKDPISSSIYRVLASVNLSVSFKIST